jgi:hypothetical protein
MNSVRVSYRRSWRMPFGVVATRRKVHDRETATTEIAVIETEGQKA